MSAAPPRRDRARSVTPERAAIALLGLLVIGAPELLGGVYPWGMLAAAIVALGALSAALWTSERRLPAPSLLDGAMLLAFAHTFLQVVPWPCVALEILVPDAVRDLAGAHQLLGLPTPTWCTLSRDPGATREEVVKGVAIVSSYAAARIVIARGSRRPVALIVAASGVVLAVVTLVHVLLDADAVFGVYEPLDVGEQSIVAPVVNLNSLAGFLALCVPLLVALALSARHNAIRLVLLFSTLVTSAILLLTRSRGGAIALVIGLCALGALAWRARLPGRSARPDLHARLVRLAMPIGVALALIMVVLSSLTSLLGEFRSGGFDKLELIARSARFVGNAPFLGVGRGAFATAFARAHEGHTRFDHPENLVVQWAAEWGVPVALCLLAALAHALTRAARKSRSWERCGALAGVLALGAQNFVDLGLELVGIAVAGAVALACATGERGALRETSARQRSLAAGGVLALCAVVVLLAAPLRSDHLAYADQELRTLLERGDDEAFRTRLRPVLLAHPSAPVPVVLGAAEALRRDGRDALAWINRSQALAPGWALPHLLAAYWLEGHGHRGQALLELALAARVDLHGARPLTCEMARRDAAGIARIAWRTRDPVMFLELAAECVGWGSEAGIILDTGLARLRPHAPGPALRAAARMLAQGQAAQALAAARRVAPQSAPSATAIEVEVRSLVALGRHEEALRLLSREAHRASPAPSLPGGPPSLRKLLELEVEVRTTLRDHAGLQKALERLRGQASNPSELLDAYRREAASWLALNRPASAMRAYQNAHSISNDTDSLRQVAELATRIGDVARARHAYARLCAQDPADTTSCRSAVPQPSAADSAP